MRILITSGGTREAIDGVRFVTNASSGATGAYLADAFAGAGWQVVLLRAESAVSANHPAVETRTFVSVADLDRACATVLSESGFDRIVHAAAVSDFVVSGVTADGVFHPAPLTGKLDSAKTLSVALTPGPKILPKLKGYSQNPDVRLVGFKLTDGASNVAVEAAVRKVLTSGADIVVHNDVKDAAGKTDRRATLWTAEGAFAVAKDNASLARQLID